MIADPSGKVQVNYNPALPATCAICNKSADGNTKFLDFQLSLDYYGAVVICEDCFREGLTILGYCPVALVEEYEAKADELLLMNVELQEANAKLNTTIDLLCDIRPDLCDRVDGANNLDNPDDEPAEQGTKATGKRTSKSDSGGRSKSLFGTSDS